MPGATQLKREGEVVSQVWEWWFLKFDLPLRNYGTPHTAPCTMAKAMATRSAPPSTLASPPPALFSPCHGRLGHAKDVGRHVQSQQRSPGVYCLCTLACDPRSMYVDFKSHLDRLRNSFDIAGSEGNVVHLKTFSGSDAHAIGGESPFEPCLPNPTTILDATHPGS